MFNVCKTWISLIKQTRFIHPFTSFDLNGKRAGNNQNLNNNILFSNQVGSLPAMMILMNQIVIVFCNPEIIIGKEKKRKEKKRKEKKRKEKKK